MVLPAIMKMLVGKKTNYQLNNNFFNSKIKLTKLFLVLRMNQRFRQRANETETRLASIAAAVVALEK